MSNKGLLFEWCIYYLIKQSLPNSRTDTLMTTAKSNYNAAPKEIKVAAKNAIDVVRKTYGEIKSVEKLSGGDEPKTDLILKTSKNKTLKCSLKYGDSIQLSSGGVARTVSFLNGVLKNLARESGYDAAAIKNILSALMNFEKQYGEIGSLPRNKIDKLMTEAERYDILLKNILGTRRNPSVSGEYAKIKLAIVEEALTGKYTFRNSDKTADHVLTEKYIRKIDSGFIKEVADKTSVRLALKGRGKTMVAGKEVRLNEIVVRFDYN